MYPIFYRGRKGSFLSLSKEFHSPYVPKRMVDKGHPYHIIHLPQLTANELQLI